MEHSEGGIEEENKDGSDRFDEVEEEINNKDMAWILDLAMQK